MAKWIIRGGAGYIRCHAPAPLHHQGHDLPLSDNLSRRGAQENLDWLRQEGVTQFVRADVRAAAWMREVLARNDDAGAVLLFSLFSSTNNVPSAMESVGVVVREGRYAYHGLPQGVDEEQPLDFHSPYSCSKASGDQLVARLKRKFGRSLDPAYGDWSPGDQRALFVANIRKAERQLGRKPRISMTEGVGRLIDWVRDNAHLFDRSRPVGARAMAYTP